MSECIAVIREFWKIWSQPHRLAAFRVLIKASLLLGALSELGWQLDRHYFSRRFPQLPISLAWSMLTVIFLVTVTQMGCSILLKVWDARRTRSSAAIRHQITALIAAYLADGTSYAEINRAAADSPQHFEACIAMALLRLRGSRLRCLRELPEVIGLRDKWIAGSRVGDEIQRRQAIELLSLLHDPAAVPALENALGDSSAGVVASAVRGLLQVTSYGKRGELLRSLQDRPLLVRVLTASEAADGEAPEMEVDLLPFARQAESADAWRASCSSLAALGASGRELLRTMSAQGEMGDAPAEALGAVLVALARGGTA
jgi:hypothetical protein